MSEILYKFSGLNGKVELYSDKVIIKRRGLYAAFVLRHIKGDKTIFFNQISGIQFKRGGFFKGYIQFTIPGGNENLKGAYGATHDENSVTFTYRQNREAEILKKRLEELIASQSKPQTYNTEKASATEEIRKYKQLFDDGIITEEEYKNKKSQLLGI